MKGHRPAAASSRFGPLVLAAFLAVLVLLPALTLKPGAAAHLPFESGSLTSAAFAERCTKFVSATHEGDAGGKATTVTLSGLTPACDGRDLELTLYGTDGQALTTGAVPVQAHGGDSIVVNVPVYNPAKVAGIAVTIGTWGIPAAWSYTSPVQDWMVDCKVLNDPTGTKTCDVKDIRVEAWGYPEVNSYNFYATVTSPSDAEDVEWELEVNLADPEFKVLANVGDSHNGVTTAPDWSCSSMPILKLRGRDDVNTQYVGGEKTVTVWIQGKAVSGHTDGGNLFNCS